MILKKPYAFLIKYFRLINLFLVILFCFLTYKLNLIRGVVNDIYRGNVTNYSTLNSTYIGFRLYLLIFIILILVGSILLLLKQKKKPLKDYLYSLIYNVVILGYLMFVSNVFLTLDEIIVEQTNLKIYTDISFLIIIPMFYFIAKFVFIVIGFNLNKFNFTQDIIELKQEEKDNEEIEVIFNKNTYKYKRSLRRALREFKYYVLENKFLIGIIIGVISVILCITLFSVNLFKSNKVKVNTNFNAGGFNYKVTNIYETQYDLNYNVIKDDSKFVVVSVSVRNNNIEASSIDFKRIRLMYGKEYVYASNYFNKFFYDLGTPYNNEPLKTNDLYNYVFVFEVPKNYKSNNYILKFYDRITVENEEVIGSYKEIKVKADNLDKKRVEKNLSLDENVIFNDKKYGSSNITIFDYELKGSYVYNTGDRVEVIKDKDINKILLILDYKLSLNENYVLSDYFNNDLEFFDKFVDITYTYNGNEKKYIDVNAIGSLEGKVMLSVPHEVENATDIIVIINFRDTKIVYKVK